MGGRWREDWNGRNAYGRPSTRLFGRRIERKRNKNREGDEASDFDGTCWMGGRNNQPKSGHIVRILLGETGAQGDDDGGGRCRIVSVVK